MSWFDAFNHAMTTLATGGFSTKDASIGFYGSPTIEWIEVVFMTSGALPLTFYIRAALHGPRSMLEDGQVWTGIRTIYDRNFEQSPRPTD